MKIFLSLFIFSTLFLASCSQIRESAVVNRKNIDEFNYTIKNFQLINFNFDKEDIYKFYYNQILTHWELYPNYQKYVNDLSSNLSKDDKIYKNWCKDFEEENLSKL